MRETIFNREYEKIGLNGIFRKIDPADPEFCRKVVFARSNAEDFPGRYHERQGAGKLLVFLLHGSQTVEFPDQSGKNIRFTQHPGTVLYFGRAPFTTYYQSSLERIGISLQDLIRKRIGLSYHNHQPDEITPFVPDIYAAGEIEGIDELSLLFQLLEMRGHLPERNDPITCQIPRLIIQWVREKLSTQLSLNRLPPEKTFEVLKNALDRNFQGEISRKSLAYEFSLSEDYITRLFKRYAGTGITEYLTERRMKLAMNVLKSGSGIAVSKAAEYCGYSSPDYFSKVFFRYWGILPGKVK